jgi:4'-phosphopantetheinyl transferase
VVSSTRGAERGHVDVVWARPIRTTALDALLNTDELARAGRLRRTADRERFVAGRALLRLSVSALLGTHPADVILDSSCPNCGTQHGKPRIVSSGADVEASVAHAGERVAVAVSMSGRVGIDVEACSATDFAGFDDIALSPRERALVNRLPETDRAAARASLWVRKEALLKMSAAGLTVSPADVEVGLGGRRRFLRQSAPVHLIGLDLGAAYRACVATEGSPRAPEVRVIDGWSWLADPAARLRATTS